MTIYIYARVSTKEQNIENQINHLQQQYNADHIYQDKLSGKNLNRNEFTKLSEIVKSGDRIICQDLSRIGRNTIDTMQFIETMTARGVKIIVSDLGSIDVTSAAGKMVITTLAAVAQMQREQMLEKQRIGIEAAKSDGRYKGKQQSQKTIDSCQKALGLIDKGLSKEDAARASKVGVATLYRFIKANSVAA